jgi:hypothetical protein
MRILFVVMLAPVLFRLPCAAEDGSRVWHTRIPLKDFLHKHTLWAVNHVSKDTKVDIKLPFAAVYDSGGRLAYFGDDIARNIEMLSSLPAPPKASPNATPFPSLQEVTAVIPALKERLRETTGGYTVLSVTLTNCKPCSTQDGAVARLASRTDSTKVKVVQVELEQ